MGEVFGTSYGDVLTIFGGPNTIYGLAGNDTLHGPDGPNTIYGGIGNDSILGSYNLDILYGDEGDDSVGAGSGNDSVFGGEGNDTFFGWMGDDTAWGGHGDDVLIGSDHNDLLIGGDGNDYLTGDAGNDVLYGGLGNDLLVGFDSGRDTYYGGDGSDELSFWGAPAGIFVDAATGTIEYAGSISYFSEIESLTGSDAGADTILGDSTANHLAGFAGDDTLRGRGGDDSLRGGHGNDLLFGDEDDDSLWGGDGRDRLFGGTGDDTLSGDLGDDIIVGGTGSNTVFGNAGTDTYLVSSRDYTIVGGSIGDFVFTIEHTTGVDVLFEIEVVEANQFTPQDDVVGLGDGDDEGDGLAGNDTVHLGAGNDVFDGNVGNDTAWGEGGNDWLEGGAGTDTLDGGQGADHFSDSSGNDTYFGGEGPNAVFADAAGAAANHDVVVFTGAPADYRLEEDPTNDWTRVVQLYGGGEIDWVYHDIELIVFEGTGQIGSAITTQSATTRPYLELARFADAAYADVPSAVLLTENWRPILAQELGLLPTSPTLAGSPNAGSYQMQVGVYQSGPAVAHVYAGVVNGENTLVVAFRGTDFNANFFGDFFYFLDFASYFELFTPLTGALQSYLDMGHVDQLWVTGHSLGGAMVQMFLQHLAVPSDIEVAAATFGSPGAPEHDPDNRILNFGHTQDWVAHVPQVIDRSPLPNLLDYELTGPNVRIVDDDHFEAGLAVSGRGVGIDEHSREYYVDSIRDLYEIHQATGDLPFLDNFGASPPDTPPVINVAAGSGIVRADEDLVWLHWTRHFDEGRETLVGGSGSDTLYGGRGNDLLLPNAGIDTMFGSPGADTIAGSLADLFLDTVEGFAQGDRIRLVGTFAQVTVTDDTQPTPLIRIDTDGGEPDISIFLSVAGINVTYDGTFSTEAGDGYTDILFMGSVQQSAVTTAAVDLTGGDGPDELSGNNAANALYAGRGNDVLHGLGGDDIGRLGEGQGNDTFYGGDGRDTADYASSGLGIRVDLAAGMASGPDIDDDALVSVENAAGGDGDDWITGSSDDNELSGAAGADFLQGHDGADTLDGGGDGDVAFGGSGDDLLHGGYGAGSGSDWLEGGDGRDAVHGSDDLDVLIGDHLFGVAGGVDDLLYGDDGSDYAHGGGGYDVLYGGAGADWLAGGTGDDLAFGDAGTDAIVAGDGNDTAYGGEDGDYLDGGNGNDRLFGNAGSDWITGGAGDDIIAGDAGDDVLFGGSGNDVFRFGSSAGRDIVADWNTGDVIDLSSLGIAGFGSLAIAQLPGSAHVTHANVLDVLVGLDPGETLGPADFVFA
jgi:Ca2+-binding RTX toxin-like protein